MQPQPIGIRTERGWEAQVGAKGVGRFVMAAFLLVWLAGWAVGEAFAITVLVKGISAWISEGAPHPSQAPAVSIAIAAFLLVWLTFWTIGGIVTIRELLRLLWGRTVVLVTPDQVAVEERIGPFQSRRAVPRDAVQAVRALPRGTVVVETTRGGLDVWRTSRSDDRERFARELRRELGITESQDASAVRLPAGWAEVVTPEGAMAVTHDPVNRRRQATFLGALTLVVLVVALLSMQLVQDTAGRWALAIVFGIGSAGLAAGTLWLARGRNEWRIEHGRLVLQRRFGDRVAERFTARGLELTLTTDSDGDEWFSLDALAEPPNPSAPAPPETTFIMGKPIPERRAVRRVASVMNDASVPRGLARWLSARANLPLVDRSTQRPRAMEIKELRAQLAASGKFGAFLDRMMGSALERQEQQARERKGGQ